MQSPEFKLMENKARLRDIELLTELTFLNDLDPAVSAHLRTHVPDMCKSNAPTGSWMDNFTCPSESPSSQCSSRYQ